MRYRESFKFKNTEKQAIEFCDRMNKQATPYVRKHHPAHFTPWNSLDGKEHLFIAWYPVSY